MNKKVMQFVLGPLMDRKDLSVVVVVVVVRFSMRMEKLLQYFHKVQIIRYFYIGPGSTTTSTTLLFVQGRRKDTTYTIES